MSKETLGTERESQKPPCDHVMFAKMFATVEALS